MADRQRYADYYRLPEATRRQFEESFQKAPPDRQALLNEQAVGLGWPRTVPMRDNTFTGKLKQLAAPVGDFFGVPINTVPENGSPWGGTEDATIYQGPGKNPLDRAKARAMVDALRGGSGR